MCPNEKLIAEECSDTNNLVQPVWTALNLQKKCHSGPIGLTEIMQMITYA